jgi:hypothetical protein
MDWFPRSLCQRFGSFPLYSKLMKRQLFSRCNCPKLPSFNRSCVEWVKDLELDPSRLLWDVSPLVLIEEFR